MDSNNFAIVDEPGALLDLHLVVELAFNNGGVSLQADLDGASMDVHHYVFPLNAELHVERHAQLEEDIQTYVVGFSFIYSYQNDNSKPNTRRADRRRAAMQEPGCWEGSDERKRIAAFQQCSHELTGFQMSQAGGAGQALARHNRRQ